MSEERKSRYELFLEEEERKAQPTKRCSKCKEVKSLSEYHRDKSAKCGVVARCKVCINGAKRKYKGYNDRFWKSFWDRTEKVGNCLEWQGPYKDKCRKTPCCKWHRKMVNVRRVVYNLALGEAVDGMVVTTTCRNYRCVRQSHLKLVTTEEAESLRLNNMPSGDQHPYRRYPEKHVRGERAGPSRLTEEDVRTIREAYACNTSSRKILAQRFGVSDVAIGHIVTGRTWRHIDGPVRPRHKTSQGEKNGRAKLTEPQVRKIRLLRESGEKIRVIAKSFAVSESMVDHIIHRRAWAHVE